MLSSWCDFPSAVPREEIISIFRDKSKRPKGKGKEVADAEGNSSAIQVDSDQLFVGPDHVITIFCIHGLQVPVSTYEYLWVLMGSGSGASYS